MSVTRSSHIVGVFTDRTVADQVVEALRNVGLENEHIYYLDAGSSGGFFGNLKSLFTGTDPDNLAHDLRDLGLSDEEAEDYVNQYNNGSTILVVNAPNRQEEVLTILHEYGASSISGESVSVPATTEPTSQPSSNDNRINGYTNSGGRVAKFFN